jgi:hypothetical protein
MSPKAKGATRRGPKVAAETPPPEQPKRKGRGDFSDIAPRYLPIAACARYFGCSPVTIWRGLRTGRLRAITIGKRRLVELASVTGQPPAA